MLAHFFCYLETNRAYRIVNRAAYWPTVMPASSRDSVCPFCFKEHIALRLNVQIDEEAYALLRQQIEAQLAQTAELKRQNDLAERAIAQAQADGRNREIADRNRIKLALNTNERVIGLAEALPQVFLAIHGIREWCKEASRRLDRMDEILLLQLTGRGNTRGEPGAGGNRPRVAELKQELEQEHAERLLVQEVQNLNELEEQAAEHGGEINSPLKLKNDIKKTKQRIVELKAKLDNA